MAPVSSKELDEFLGASQAAALRSNDYCTRELCDNLLNSITTNIKICKYTNPTASSLNFDDNRSLIILHVNIHSLHKNFDSLYEFLVTLSFSPDIICLIETRLKGEALINIDLPLYKFIHVDSAIAAIYVSNKLQFEVCLNQHVLNSSECLWLKLSENNSKSKFIVGVVYRHPDQTKVDDFLASFSTGLTNLSNSKKVYYILGDFNINILQDNRSNSASEYINLIVSHGAVPVITIPTRVTSNSSTLIDHIITNNTELDLNPAVIEADISNHFPVLCIITKPRPQQTYESKKMLYRDKSSFRVDSFRENLEVNLINVFSQQPELNNNNFIEMFELFSTTILSTINAPLKPLSRKQKKTFE